VRQENREPDPAEALWLWLTGHRKRGTVLLRSRTVYVPALREVDADLAEFGALGPRLCAQYGQAAVEAGSGTDEGKEPMEAATDAIANVLHWAVQVGADTDAILRSATTHFDAERMDA